MVGKNESSFWLTFWLTSQHKANILAYANGLYSWPYYKHSPDENSCTEE